MPYVLRTARSNPTIELLAAPVFEDERYQKRPIYFSDVVVRADSPFRRFADLRGGRWAYNDPGSQSGFHVVRHFLATKNLHWDFFRQIIATGAHRKSLQMILDGHIDGAAIDSTVLDSVLAAWPELAAQIRIVETLGPSPIPPWIVSSQLPAPMRAKMRKALLEMHQDREAGPLLQQSGIERFTAVTHADYEPIRHMVAVADAAGLQRDEAFLALPNVVTAPP